MLPGLNDRKLTFTKAHNAEDQRSRRGIEPMDSPARTGRFVGFHKNTGISQPRNFLFADQTLSGGVPPGFNAMPGLRQSSYRSMGNIGKKDDKTVHVPETFTVQMAEVGDLVAAGGSDGIVRVFSTRTGHVISQLPTEKSDNMVMSIRFVPHDKTGKLVATYTDGSIRWWDAYSKDCIRRLKEEDNEVYSMAFSQSADLMATAGLDHKVRVYQVQTGQMVTDLERIGDQDEIRGHSNRVFAVKYHPQDNNLVVSAGWDDCVMIWDMRQSKVARYFHGPHVCGESVDIFGHSILVGSWRCENQLQLYDLDSGKLMEEVEWDKTEPKGTHIYAAAFTKDGRHFAAAGNNETCAKIFSLYTGDEVGCVNDVNPEHVVSSFHFHPNSEKLTIGLPSNTINVYDVKGLGL